MTLSELEADYNKLSQILKKMPYGFITTMQYDLNIPRNWFYKIKDKVPLCPKHTRIKEVLIYCEKNGVTL